MFKSSLCFLNVVTYAFALHNFLPNGEAPIVKKSIYTNFVPPSAERFFATPAAAVAPSSVVPSTKAVAPLLPAAANAPYLAPYTYQTQYSPYAFKQYPYYPGVFYPPQPFVYPAHSVGPPPSSVVYIPRYPAPAESGNEQGSSSGSTGGWSNYIPSNWQSWGSNWGSYFPSWPGSGSSGSAEGAAPGTPAEGSSSQTGASASSSHRGGKPEKLETAEATSTPQPQPQPSSASSQDSVKSDTDKNAVTVELPEQQYVLVGQPQFFGHFAAFPADRDPTTLNGAAKGAVSSFLFYKDQNQHVVPQKFNEIPNVPGSASLAYQRFLLLSKQRSEDGPKPVSKSDSTSSTTPPSSPVTVQKDISQPSDVTSTSAAAAAAAASASAAPESDNTSSETSPENSSGSSTN